MNNTTNTHRAKRTGTDGEYIYRGYTLQRIDAWMNAEVIGGVAKVHWNITAPGDTYPFDSGPTLSDCKYWIDCWCNTNGD